MVGQLAFDAIKPGITGEKLKADAEEWRRRNPRLYRWMFDQARQAMYHDERTSINKLAEAARDHHIEGYADGFKLNNNLRAPLARMMIAECPDLAKVFRCRSSKADWA